MEVKMGNEDEYKIVTYEDQYEKIWDKFVTTDSINGTFLHMRNFLNYHSKEKFTDCSYMVFDGKDNLSAVVPACVDLIDGIRTLVSHKGSTYGGIVINRKSYKTEQILKIVSALEKKAKKDGIQKIIYKLTADAYCMSSNGLLEYALFYNNYAEYKELSLLVDYSYCGGDLFKNMSHGKRQCVQNCRNAGCTLQKLDSQEEIEVFYDILCENLQKYDVNPVHTLKELNDIHFNRLKDETAFYGIYLKHRLIAGAMMFYFHSAKAAHTQYLCARAEYNQLSPMSYLYYSLMVEMRELGFSKLTWGIVTEDHGRKLNLGLAKSKESYGGEYSINKTFYKVI